MCFGITHVTKPVHACANIMHLAIINQNDCKRSIPVNELYSFVLLAFKKLPVVAALEARSLASTYGSLSNELDSFGDADTGSASLRGVP